MSSKKLKFHCRDMKATISCPGECVCNYSPASSGGSYVFFSDGLSTYVKESSDEIERMLSQ